MVFETTGALGFEDVSLRLIQGASETPPPAKQDGQTVTIGSLADVCRIHEISR